MSQPLCKALELSIQHVGIPRVAINHEIIMHVPIHVLLRKSAKIQGSNACVAIRLSGSDLRVEQ